MDAPWRIELLGGLRATRGDQVITHVRTQKTGALLAYLAYYPQRPHPRDHLIELLWPEAEPAAGSNSLSQALSSLRRQLEPPGAPAGTVLVANRTSVRLNPAAVTTDVAGFEAALHTAASAGNDTERALQLGRAVELYRGELLPGSYERWVLEHREWLAESYFQALRQLLALLEQEGDLPRALECARRGVLTDPLREEPRRDLMQLYAAVGQPEAALRHYQELERLLRQELNAEPSPTTQALARELSRPPTSRPSAPAGRAAGAQLSETLTFPHPPVPLTRFFGREPEIEQLRTMLVEQRLRLVTLTGPGGSGKTRLALEVVRQLKENWSGAVGFVPLADLAEGSLLTITLRDALHLPRTPNRDPVEQLVAALSRQPALLLLDSFEHLVDKGTRQVQHLLEQVPSLACLITSRRRLDLAGEHERHVLPLPPPPDAGGTHEVEQYASVQLFVDRVQAVRPEFRLTPAHAADVAAICRRLEGIPLALELAAARAQVLTPAQIESHLERRFDFLVDRHRGVAARHRTLRATIDWSYQLLEPELQRFFARLSVFCGGWTLSAAATVCEAGEERFDRDSGQRRGPGPGEALEKLEQLRGCSLVIVEEGTAEMRFRMLDTLREYGREQLDPAELADLERRHASYYLDLVEQAELELTGPDQARWLDCLEREHNNLRAALDGAVAREEVEVGLQLGGALYWFWYSRGHWLEGRERLTTLLGLPGAAARTAARARALNAAAGQVYALGEVATARSLCEEALTINRELDERRGTAASLAQLGIVSRAQRNFEAAWVLLEESLAISRELGDRAAISYALHNLGNNALHQEDRRTARAFYEESLGIRRALGHQRGIASTLGCLAIVLEAQGDWEAARAAYEESLTICRDVGDQQMRANTLNCIGHLLASQGDYETARARYRESLTIHHEIGNTPAISWCLENLAALAVAEGQPERAARLFGAAEALRPTTGTNLAPDERNDYERAVALTQLELGTEVFAEEWAAGCVLPLEQAVAFALEESDHA